MQPSPSRPPTMDDVARASGLSRSTVSRVFTQAGRVSPDAQIRVREAAHRLGYVHDLMASELAGGRRSQWGLLIRDATNPAYGHLHAAMDRAVDEAGRALISVTARGDEYGDAELRGLRRLLGLRVAGLFVSTGVTAPEDLLALSSTVPMLLVGRPNEDPRLHSVSYDEAAHGRMVADRIAALGHRRLAVLTAPEMYSRVFRLRSSAVTARCRELGLTVHEVELLPVRRGVVRALEAARDERLTCIVCPVDYVALELLRAKRERGVAVPEEVSVVGFDGITDGLDLIGLATVRLPIRATVDTAVARMTELLEHDGPAAPAVVHDLVPGDFVEGRSLGPAPAM